MPEGSFRPSSVSAVVLLVLMVGVGQISIALYLPSLPSIAEALGTTTAKAQLTMTVYFAGFAVAQLMVGPLSDRYGRRPVLLGGVALYVAASLICAMAQDVDALIAARFFQALGACSGQVIGRAIVRDTTTGGADAARLLSVVAMSVSLTPAIAPSLGGQLEGFFGWRSVFVMMAIIGAGLLLYSTVRLPETNRYLNRDALNVRGMVRSYGALIRDKTFMGHSVAMAFIFGGLFSYQTGSPDILIAQLGYSPQVFGLLVLFNVLGFLGGASAARYLADRWSARYLVALSAVCCLVAGVAMAVPARFGIVSALSIIGPAVLFMGGMGLAIAPATAGAMRNVPHIAGAASALMGFLQMGFAMLGSLAVSLLRPADPLAMTSVFGILGALVLLGVFLIPKAPEGGQEPGESPIPEEEPGH